MDRKTRVALLLMYVVLMGLIDFGWTAYFVWSDRMFEVNPVANMLLEYCPRPILGLLALKLLTLMACVSLLWVACEHAIGETAAWICVLIMTSTLGLWIGYGIIISEGLAHG